MGKWKELAGIHTCHADCQRPACVAARKAAAGKERTMTETEYSGNGTAGREADVKPTGFFFQMPQREWQWLTDDEIGEIIEASQITLKNYCSEEKQIEFARAIEAKLRRKNEQPCLF